MLGDGRDRPDSVSPVQSAICRDTSHTRIPAGRLTLSLPFGLAANPVTPGGNSSNRRQIEPRPALGITP